MTAFLDYIARTLALVHKEFLTLFKDPAGRTLLFIPAFLEAILFGYGATYDLTNVPYVLLDHSRGAAATELVSHLDGTGVFHRVATLTSSSQISEVVDRGEALLALTIPSDFETLLASGQQAPLQVIVDGRNSATAAAATAHIASVVGTYNQSLGHGPSIEIIRRAWFNPNLESRWNLMTALIASLSMLQTLMLAALSVAREREQGTFDQLLVTPFTPLQILIGKALPSILIGMGQSTIIFLIILFWFQIPLAGSVWLLYLGLLIFTTASVGIGLSISALSKNMQQAMLYSFMLIMPLMLLSGLLTPIHNMPKVLQTITWANPLRFAIDITRRVYLEGATLAQVAPLFLPMFLIGALTLPLATWLFRNRLT